MIKDKFLHFRVSSKDHEIITNKANKQNKTTSQFLLDKALGKSDIVMDMIPIEIVNE